MGKETHIGWTCRRHSDGTVTPGATVNFWIGCKKVSEGCKFCYAERDMERYGKEFGKVTRCKDVTFYSALKWQEPKNIFTCSWSDFFIEEADQWRDDAWGVIRATKRHNWLILTKRPERIKEHLPADWGNGWDNVWLGVTAENAKRAEQRIPILRSIPAKVRFLSVEPLLEGYNIRPYLAHSVRCNRGHNLGDPCETTQCNPIHWVITGGESGAKSKIRPAELDWFRSLRDACQTFGTLYYHKQHGGSSTINGIWGGRELDGRTWDEQPEY